MKLSPALYRALKAVEAGEVTRRVNRRGSQFVGPKGVGAKSIWLAKMNDFIRDGSETNGILIRSTKQVLTEAGRMALAS